MMYGLVYKEILRLKDRLNSILSHHTGKSVEDIEKDTDRDRFLSAEEQQALAREMLNYLLIPC